MKIKHPGIARVWLISENFVLREGGGVLMEMSLLPVFKTWEPWSYNIIGGDDRDAAVRVSSTLTPPDEASDTDELHVHPLPVGLGDALT